MCALQLHARSVTANDTVFRVSTQRLTRFYRAALAVWINLPLIAEDVEVAAFHSCQHKQNEPCLLITSVYIQHTGQTTNTDSLSANSITRLTQACAHHSLDHTEYLYITSTVGTPREFAIETELSPLIEDIHMVRLLTDYI
jgi:hypothetical protein